MTRKELKRLRIAAAIVLTAAIWAIWFPLVTSSNFRADSDRMLYHAEVALTQYVNEGRAGLVFLLRLLGLDHWHPVLSGVIFLICFAASGWLMGYYIYRFSGRQWNDANLLFVILFGTSPVWVFQAYFVLQIAGIGIGMLLLTLLAGLDVCVYTREKYGLAAKCACALLSSALLCFSITIYQALIVYYFTVIFLCLACHFRSGRGIKPSQAAIWLLQVLAAVFLRFGDDAVADIDVVQGACAVPEPFVPGVSGHEVPVGDASGPAPVAVADVSLQAGHDAEDVTLHQEETEAVSGDGVQFRDVP